MLIIDVEAMNASLSELLDSAIASGQPFVSARQGKQLARVEPISDPQPHTVQRLGFMEGQFSIPDDFDEMYREEIEEMFYGKP